MKIYKLLVSILMISFCLACGGNFIEEPTPSFSSPLITNLTSTLQNGTPFVKIEWYFPVFEEPIIKGFRVERAENNGEFSEVKLELAANQRSVDLQENIRGGKVSYRISTVSEKNPQSSLIESYFAPSYVVANSCLALSSSLIQTSDGKPSVYLNWSLNPNSTAYRGSFQVFRATPNSPAFSLLAATTNLNFLDDKIEIGQNYLYSVRLATTGCPSNVIPISITKQNIGFCPSSFKTKIIPENNTKSVLLSWEAQLSNISHFVVKRANSINGEYQTIKENLQSTVFLDKEKLKPNTSYFYKIVGFVNSQPPNTCETNVLEVKF